MTAGATFDATVARLAAAGCVAAPEEAAELVATAADAASLESMIARREQGEPLPWITGSLTFAGQRLAVATGVYVPRFQTEELALRAAALLPPGGRALDLCTGAGAIAAHLQAQVPTAVVIGIDRDEHSVRCARGNGVVALVADVAALPLPAGLVVDVVTAVAPYVPTPDLRFLPADVQRHEPQLALDGGADGLDLVRHVVRAAGQHLRPGGWLLTELGGNQDAELAVTLGSSGFDGVEPWHDEDGDLRGITARRGTH